ncbi:hypothetical protein [Streptomyces sp. NPDC059076]|uniref:hypothetical protein n=1 Tax=unclassified Streptomyces TaxID=2593676 RepID=UPI0036CA6401
MIDNLGFHTDRDLQSELAAVQRQVNALEGRVTVGLFYSPEDRHNTYGQLTNLQVRANTLAAELAAENEELDRLTAAVRIVGDPDLGFIAYVVFGPAALPMESRYEVRVIERRGGYTVPGTVRRNIPAAVVSEASRELLTAVVKRGGHAELWGNTIRDYRVQVTAY